MDRSEKCYDLAHVDIKCVANISLEPNQIGVLQDSSKSQIVDLLFENNEMLDHQILDFTVVFGSLPIFCGAQTQTLKGNRKIYKFLSLKKDYLENLLQNMTIGK